MLAMSCVKKYMGILGRNTLITNEEADMNADTFKGKWSQFKGELKRQWGKFTDDDLMQIEGNYDKFKGKVQERYGDRKDEIETWANKWYGEAKDTAKQAQSR
jgi:uncharacterized protein YjbJ (UPF0337 family)